MAVRVQVEASTVASLALSRVVVRLHLSNVRNIDLATVVEVRRPGVRAAGHIGVGTQKVLDGCGEGVAVVISRRHEPSCWLRWAVVGAGAPRAGLARVTPAIQ